MNWLRLFSQIEEKITSVFSYTNCADELFIQTIAFNCGFKDHIFQPVGKQAANLRCIDWSRGKNGNPYTYRLKDIDMLIPKIGGGQRKPQFICQKIFGNY